MNTAMKTSAAIPFAAFLCGLLAIADEGPGKTGPRDEGKPSAEGKRDQPSAITKSQRKTARIFKAYDKNADGKIVFAEWLAMKEGAMDDARKAREQKWFGTADADGDGGITVEEFHAWLNRKPGREGPRNGPADAPKGKSAEKGDR